MTHRSSHELLAALARQPLDVVATELGAELDGLVLVQPAALPRDLQALLVELPPPTVLQLHHLDLGYAPLSSDLPPGPELSTIGRAFKAPVPEPRWITRRAAPPLEPPPPPSTRVTTMDTGRRKRWPSASQQPRDPRAKLAKVEKELAEDIYAWGAHGQKRRRRTLQRQRRRLAALVEIQERRERIRAFNAQASGASAAGQDRDAR